MKGLVLVTIALLLSASTTQAYVYGRCEYAETLRWTYGFAKSSLGDWVCLTQWESSYNTAAYNDNTNGSRDYGIYQINDYYWCHSTNNPTYNDCSIECSKLWDNDISDDVVCAELIYARHGFTAWYGWINHCQGQDVSSYISDCNV